MRKLWRAIAILPNAALLIACSSGAEQVELESNLTELMARAERDQIYIEGGKFVMGDFGAVQNGQWLPYFPPTAEMDAAHTVELSSFSLSSYETTWKDYDTYSLIHDKPTVIRGGGEEYPREAYLQNLKHDYDLRKPARVTWQEAKDYCLWLRDETGIAFDLPTSAQWEYAARNRGSKDWIYPTHDGKATPNEARRDGEGCIYWTGVCSVGTNLPPNPLGLYDMAGNEEEWVEDWYSETYYGESDGAVNPAGPLEGTKKEVRSLETGSLSFSFSRRAMPPVLSNGSTALAGFRCAVQRVTPPKNRRAHK